MINATASSLIRPARLFRLLFAAVLFLSGLTMVSAQNLVLITNLVSFNGTNGQQPSGILLQARDGYFYGTTLYGGTNAVSAGTIFRISPLGAFSNLASFNITNGADPSSGVIQAADGNFYGTTAYGGAYTNIDPTGNGFGTVFKLTTNGVLSTLASFDGAKGKSPNALIETSPGVFYGTANSGGAYSNFSGIGYGTVFKADTNGLLTNLLSLNDTNGSGPSAGLLMVNGGSLYGTTDFGGPYEYGIAFRLAGDARSVSAQFNFTLTNGGTPNALIYGRDGNLYGTTLFGGSNHLGTIFQLTTNLGFTTLACVNGTNGTSPTALIQGKDGNFYGVTSSGGSHGYGVVFELTTNGILNPLYHFTGGSDGFSGTSLVQGQDGNFYGTTGYGGDSGRGNVFKLTIVPPPTIQKISRSANTVTFTWTAVSNLTYTVQYITNLTQTNWTKLQSITATNAIGSATDSIGPDPRRFYRVTFP